MRLSSSTTTSHLEIQLTATDSAGLSTTITQKLQPRRVTISLASQPSGFSVNVNGTTFTTPAQFTSWQNYQLRLNAPDQRDAAGTSYVFASWSNGGAQVQTIATPATAAALLAVATAMPATCVPCDDPSGLVSGGLTVRSSGATTLPGVFRSAWAMSVPRSMTPSLMAGLPIVVVQASVTRASAPGMPAMPPAI